MRTTVATTNTRICCDKTKILLQQKKISKSAPTFWRGYCNIRKNHCNNSTYWYKHFRWTRSRRMRRQPAHTDTLLWAGSSSPDTTSSSSLAPNRALPSLSSTGDCCCRGRRFLPVPYRRFHSSANVAPCVCERERERGGKAWLRWRAPG